VLKQDKAGRSSGYLERAYASCYEGVADAKSWLRLEAERGAVVRARIVDADSVPVALRTAELQERHEERGWYPIAEGATSPTARSRSDHLADRRRTARAGRLPARVHGLAGVRLASLGNACRTRLQRPGAIEGTVFGRTVRRDPERAWCCRTCCRNATKRSRPRRQGAGRSPRGFRFVAVPPGPHQLALVGRDGSARTAGRHRVAPGAAVVQDCLAPR